MTQREMGMTAHRRPTNYGELSPSEQWAIDKDLGILDWDGKHREFLEFGLNAELPDDVTLAWGARLIFPDDLVWNRQSVIGKDHPDCQKFGAWCDKHGVRGALKEARRLSEKRLLLPSDNRVVVLYEDEQGIVKGNPNASYGYLYVVAYFKAGGKGQEGG